MKTLPLRMLLLAAVATCTTSTSNLLDRYTVDMKLRHVYRYDVAEDTTPACQIIDARRPL